MESDFFALLSFLNRKLISLRDAHAFVLHYNFRNNFHQKIYKKQPLDTHFNAIIFKFLKSITTKEQTQEYGRRERHHRDLIQGRQITVYI
jgi:hypothetical protein